MTVAAIKSLTVNSYGRFGERGGDDAYSQINGNVGALVVKGDFIATNFYVTGNLTSASVGGSVIGGTAAGDGQIYATEDVGKVTIKKDLRGGSAASTGFVGAGHDIGTVAIGGSIYGGAGQYSGYLGNIYVGHTTSPLDLGTVTIGKDLVGGSGLNSGGIDAGSIVGAGGMLDTVTIKGSIVGGTDTYAGRVSVSGDMGTVSLGGSLFGGEGTESGSLVAEHIDTVTIGGSLYGGKGSYSGELYASPRGIGLLKIRGDVQGGTGPGSGSVDGGGQIDVKIIGGLVILGSGAGSGVVN